MSGRVVLTVRVGAVALFLAACSPTQSSRDTSLSGAVGYRWQVVGLRDAFGKMPVPGGLHAGIAFTRDGHVLGNDTLNALGASYRANRRGYTTRDAGTTLVGSMAMARDRKRIKTAVDAMFPMAAPRPIEIVVRVHRDNLTLSRSSFTLTLRRAGIQPNFGSQRPG